jgi:hypothetical protein
MASIIATCAHLGRIAEARAHIDAPLAFDPGFTIACARGNPQRDIFEAERAVLRGIAHGRRCRGVISGPAAWGITSFAPEESASGRSRWPGQSPQPDLEGPPRRKNEWFAEDDWTLSFDEVLG